MKNGITGAIALIVTTVIASSALVGQQTQTPPRQQEGKRGVVQQPGQQPGMAETPTLSSILASKIMLENHCEIQIADLAAQRSTNPEVKQYAQMLANKHRELGESLKTMVPPELVTELANPMPMKNDKAQRTVENNQESSRTQGNNIAGAADQRTDRQDRQARTETAGAGNRFDADHVLKHLCEIEKAAAMNNLQSVKEMLNSKSEKEFDMCFLGLQIVAHTQMISCLEAIQNADTHDMDGAGAGQNSLASTIEKTLPSLREHLDKAQSLAKNLETSEKAGR